MITAEIALELSKLRDSTNKAVAEVRKMKTGMKREGDGLGASIFGGLKKAAATAAVAAGAAIAGALAGTAMGLKNAFDLGGSLTDAAARIGTTAGRAQVLGQAFENAGMAADDVSQTINKMQKGIAEAAAGGQSAGIFKSLKLDIQELLAMDPADAFTVVGDAIAKIDDPTKRAAASMEIFGKSGGKLLSLFTDSGGIAFAQEQLGKQSEILDKSAGDFDRASDILGGAVRKIQGFFVGMGSQLVGALMPLLDEFNKLDLAGMGERFGAAIKDAMNFLKAAWQEIDFAEAASLLGTALKVGFLESINVLYKGMMAAMSAFGQLMVEEVKNAITLFQILTTPEFWKGMLNAFIGIAHTFSSVLLAMIGTALEYVKKIPGAASLIGDMDKDFRNASAQRARDAAGRFGQAGTNFAPAVDAAMTRIAEAARNIADAFQDRFAGTEDIFNTSEDLAKLEEALQRIKDRAAKIAAEAKDTAAGTKFDAEKTAGDGDGGGKSRIRTPGLFASAVNLIMGRSVNELIHDEAKKTNKLLEDIKKNTSQRPPTKPTTSNSNGDWVARYA